MKEVYLDINGDILNEILGLESTNRIDDILEEIIDNSPTGSKSKKKKKETKPKTSKSKKKKDEKPLKIVKIKRIK